MPDNIFMGFAFNSEARGPVMLIRKTSFLFIFSVMIFCFMPASAEAQLSNDIVPPRVLSPDLTDLRVIRLYINTRNRAVQKKVPYSAIKRQEYQTDYRSRVAKRVKGYKKPYIAGQSHSRMKSRVVRHSPASAIRAGIGKSVQNTKRNMDPEFWPQTVSYSTKEAPGVIIINTDKKFLYLVQKNGKARRYGIGVGREGFGWKGNVLIRAKRKWPVWRPPEQMRSRKKARGVILPKMVQGGLENPLGARAMYLYKDSKDTLYRIHGTNQPWTIGKAVSSGCIRMLNGDVIDLYERVPVGTKVVVI